MVGARDEHPFRVGGPPAHAVLEHDLRDLLVVRVVPRAAGGEREPLHERRAVRAPVEVRLRPRLARLDVEGDVGLLQAVEDRAGAKPARSGRSLDLDRLHFAGVGLVVGGPLEERGGEEDELHLVAVRKVLHEPAVRAHVLVAVLGHREVVRVPGLDHGLGGPDPDRVEEVAETLPRAQELGDALGPGRLGLANELVNEITRLGRSERLRVADEVPLALRRARVRDGGYPILLDVDRDRVARHLVGRVPARPDRHVEGPRVEDGVRPVPPNRVTELDGGARPIALVAGGVGAVVEHAVLHVDEAREDELGEHLAPVLRLFHEAQEHPVRLQDLAALHEGEPVAQPLAERTLQALRLLVGPMDHGRGRRAGGERAAPRVVPRGLQDLLVPDVEPGRDVPDGLGHREPRRLGRQHLHQVEGRPCAEEAVVVVDEVDETVVDPLVVRHVGVRAVDAGRLEQHFFKRTALAVEVVVDLARADLVAVEDALLQGGVAAGNGCGSSGGRRFAHALAPAQGSIPGCSVQSATDWPRFAPSGEVSGRPPARGGRARWRGRSRRSGSPSSRRGTGPSSRRRGGGREDARS